MKPTYQPTGETWADRAPKRGDLAMVPAVGCREPLRVHKVVTLIQLLAGVVSPASRAYHRRKNPDGLVMLESLDGRYTYTVPLGKDDDTVTHMVACIATGSVVCGGVSGSRGAGEGVRVK